MKKAKLYPCKNCGKLVPIRSKGLCPSCRYLQRKAEGTLPDYSKPKPPKKKDKKVIQAMEKLKEIAKISEKNKYFDSFGNSYSQSEVNNNITKAKEQKIEEFREEHGYLFCEDCGVNEQSAFKLDCSHEISVKECKETRRIELAWSVANIKLRCRKCHQEKDGLN